MSFVRGLALLSLFVIAVVAAVSVLSADRGRDHPATLPTIANTADLGPDRAETIYQAIRGGLSTKYALSDDPVAVAYQTWTRLNRAPFRANGHGGWYANVYASPEAWEYGRYEGAGPLPEGAIIAMDSFAVTTGEDVLSGPLFLMEKVATGTGANDWRFMRIEHDGSIAGMTGGIGPEAVRVCAECHGKAGPTRDHLYFMPPEVRRKD
jgi:hypothetical protein